MNFLFLIVSPYKLCKYAVHCFIIAISIAVMMPFVWMCNCAMSSDESVGIAKHFFFFVHHLASRSRECGYVRSGCTKHLSYISNFHADERRATFIFARAVCINCMRAIAVLYVFIRVLAL